MQLLHRMIETRNEAEWNTYGKIIWTEYVQQIIHKYVGSIIKYDEYDRRAAKHANLPNVYPKSDKFPSSAQFSKVLLKSENKVRL